MFLCAVQCEYYYALLCMFGMYRDVEVNDLTQSQSSDESVLDDHYCDDFIEIRERCVKEGTYLCCVCEEMLGNSYSLLSRSVHKNSFHVE